MAIWQRIKDWWSGSVGAGDGVAPAGKPLTSRKLLGNKGEEHAMALLKKRGDTLVVRNWSCKFGELDLVTWSHDTLVFTEVRTRSSADFGTPAETVDRKKQEKIRRTAQHFLSVKFRGKNLPSCRYNVVWIMAKNGEIAESGIIAGAFV